jgi:type II secretory ATPase GspE/PulE/Tfp pilus assembly ATPase PilB-like protein
MTGYRGRLVLTELLVTDQSELGRAILSRAEASQIEQLAVQHGMTPVRQRSLAAVEAGLTSPEEIRRALGWRDDI